MKQIFEIKPNYLNMYEPLCQNDMPPTLYSLMNSKVNFGKEPNEQVSISNLPSVFKDYLFDFNYPLNNNLKSDFETTFLKHYMFRRINYDTYISFKLHLEVKLNDIMPKYNKMFEGFESLDFEGIKETTERSNLNARTIAETDYRTSAGNSNGSNSVASTSTNDNRFSDTPQNAISDVQAGTYVTDYTYNTGTDSSYATSSSSSSSTSSIANNKTDNDTEREDITKIKLDTLEEYKKFMEIANNIYSMIFKECDSLFYGIL